MKNNIKTEIKYILGFFGDHFDPFEFNDNIKVTPSAMWLKGDAVQGSKAIRKESAWEFETPYTKSLFSDEASRIILHNFKDKTKTITKLMKKYKASAKLDIVLYIYEGQTPAVTFNRKLVTFLNQINAEVDIDMYVICSD